MQLSFLGAKGTITASKCLQAFGFKKINTYRVRLIIISVSSMAMSGRILSHLKVSVVLKETTENKSGWLCVLPEYLQQGIL